MEPKFNPSDRPDNKVENTNSQAIAAFFADLKLYDKQHNPQTWASLNVAANLINNFDKQAKEFNQEDDQQPPEALLKMKEQVEANLTTQDLLDRHGALLEKLGLELESPNKEGDFDQKETYATGEMTVNVVDRTKLVSFLESLSKENFGEFEKKLLEIIAEKLVRQVEQEYDLKVADDRFLELFSGLAKIIDQYKRLEFGFGKIAELEKYIVYAKRRSLVEYVDARKHQIFEPIGEGFNLSTYQIDADSKYYQKKWNKNFFEVLARLGDNPNAGLLYKEVFNYGVEALGFGKAAVSKTIEELDHKQVDPTDAAAVQRHENRKEVLRGIKDVQDEITEKLEKYRP